MTEIDAAELAALRDGLKDGCLLDGETAVALIDALEKARGREISDRAKAEIREALTNAEAERDSARALLREAEAHLVSNIYVRATGLRARIAKEIG